LANTKGSDVSLRVYGDEFYARYETVDGYSVIYDLSLGRFVYAQLRDGHFIPSGLDLSMDPPPESRPILRRWMKFEMQRPATGFPEDGHQNN